MKIIDCRNMACPLPVVTVKRALENTPGDSLKVLIDEGPARENVTRFVVNRGFLLEETPVEGGYALLISGPGAGRSSHEAGEMGRKVLLIASDRLGDGAEELGRLLMKNFVITLLDVEAIPERMLFLNSGVFLTTEGSEVLEALEKLAERGVEILSCGVCLDFYHRREKLKAGTVTNMFTIAESLLQGGSMVRL